MNEQRVLRGRSWYFTPETPRSVRRNWNNADSRTLDIGFRLIQEGTDTSQRCVRGGSWHHELNHARSAVRRGFPATKSLSLYALGFRLVREQKT